MTIRTMSFVLAGLAVVSLSGCNDKKPELDGGPSKPIETPHNPGPVPPLNVPSASPAVAVTLTGPATPVKAGQPFSVTWTGPNGPDDYIDLVDAGRQPVGDERAYVKTAKGNPATLTAPVEPGIYDLRYVQDHGDRTVIGRATITVTK
jgi:hypothetical protein